MPDERPRRLTQGRKGRKERHLRERKGARRGVADTYSEKRDWGLGRTAGDSGLGTGDWEGTTEANAGMGAGTNGGGRA